MNIYTCKSGKVRDENNIEVSVSVPGLYDGFEYERICIGMHITTLQDLVTYKGVSGPDKGRYFYTTVGHWRKTFEVVQIKPSEGH